MSNLRAGFEKEVRLRLAQKAKPNQPEDVLLVKAFKYFDLNNSGTVTKDEFYKALLRMGVNSFNEKQSSELFDLYDENQNGELDYKEFSSILFGIPISPAKVSKKVPTETSRPQTATSTVQATTEPQIDYNDPSIQQSLNTLKDALKRRGTTGILGFARMFRIVDDNNNKKIEFEEFYKVLKDYQVELPLFHVQKLFAFFDKDRSGSVDYDELLMGIRGTLSPFRKTFVDKAFAKLDANGNGIIEVQDLKGVYDVSKHPDVINGKKRESDVLEDFLRTFESYSFYKGKLDNTVTHQEFEDYYGYISASIDSDEYFAQMMNTVWKLDKPAGKFEESKAGEVVVEEYNHLEGNIGFMLKRLKQRLSARGPKAFAVLHKILRGIDADKDGIITQKELLKALKDNRLEVTEQDAQAIVEHYDNNRKGQLPYNTFFEDLVGKHSGFRRELLDLAWNSLNGSKDNKVDIVTLKSTFKGLRNHPDVKSGRKTDMQVSDEYNEAWDIFRSSVSRETTDYIGRQEFDKFFLCLGATIEDDKMFEQTILQTFKIKPDPALRNWAGGAGGRKDFDPNAGYIQNMHRSLHAGGSVSSTAPFGTSAVHENPYEQPKTISTPGKRSGKAQQLEEERPTTRGGSQQGTPQGKGPGQAQGLGDKDLLEYLRRKIISRGTRGILGIARLFKNIDDDNSKSISFQEFDKVLKDFRIDIVEEDAWKIFNYMDVSKDGNIDYEEFLRAIKGEMSENRQKIVIEVFERLDKDKNGVLTIDDIRELYNAKQHPDVKTGKKTEDDVLMEFLETFEQHHVQMSRQGKDNKVTLAEFIEYYNHISCSIDDDNYFEFMMNNCWNTNRSYKKGWRGDS